MREIDKKRGILTPKLPTQAEGDGTEEYIQITVSDPQKIGEGMSSYMAYKVTTKTNVSYFRWAIVVVIVVVLISYETPQFS